MLSIICITHSFSLNISFDQIEDYNELIGSLIIESGKQSFCNQSLVCLFQDEAKQQKVSKNSADPSLITETIAIERNTLSQQWYLVQGLERSLHFSAPTSEFQKLVERPFPTLQSQNTTSSVSHRTMKHVFIPQSTNYISDDGRTVVFNRTATIPNSTANDSPEQEAIKKCNGLIIEMFHTGLANCFSFIEKKRSGVSKHLYSNAEELIEGSCSVSIKSVHESCLVSNAVMTSGSKSSLRKRRVRYKKSLMKKKGSINQSALPTITCGWSTNDAHQYKSNRSTIASNLKPFLRDGGLPTETKRILMKVMKTVLSFMPSKSVCFNMDLEEDADVLKFRRKMAEQFGEMLTGEKVEGTSVPIEGVTILLPLSISAHRDVLNCFLEGMTSVLQINAKIPLNTDTIPSGRDSVIWKWLELNGYHDWFPCSIILYSRKSVHLYCQKLSAMEKFAAKDSFRRCIKWALMNRINDDVDYIGNIWNNDKFVKRFNKQSNIIKDSRFQGKMLQITAAYDTTVSVSH